MVKSALHTELITALSWKLSLILSLSRKATLVTVNSLVVVYCHMLLGELLKNDRERERGR